MTDQTVPTPEDDLTVEGIRRLVDAWYLECLALVGLQADVAILKIASLRSGGDVSYDELWSISARSITTPNGSYDSPVHKELLTRRVAYGRWRVRRLIREAWRDPARSGGAGPPSKTRPAMRRLWI